MSAVECISVEETNESVTDTLPLTGQAEALAIYTKLQGLLADRISSIASGCQVGAYITGPPGVGKTFIAQNVLKHGQMPMVMRNARMTPAGLFRLLEEHTHNVIILDDVHNIVCERASQQILLAALDGQAGTPRTITLTNAHGIREFNFDGGLIAISNIPMARDPMAEALGSRMVLHEFNPPRKALTAFLRQLASAGDTARGLTPAQCGEVAEFVIAGMDERDLPMDVRVYLKALGDYKYCLGERVTGHWRDLVSSSLDQAQTTRIIRPVSKQVEIANEQQIAADLMERYPNDRAARARSWRVQTGKSEPTLYRRIEANS